MNEYYKQIDAIVALLCAGKQGDANMRLYGIYSGTCIRYQLMPNLLIKNPKLGEK